MVLSVDNMVLSARSHTAAWILPLGLEINNLALLGH